MSMLHEYKLTCHTSLAERIPFLSFRTHTFIPQLKLILNCHDTDVGENHDNETFKNFPRPCLCTYRLGIKTVY